MNENENENTIRLPHLAPPDPAVVDQANDTLEEIVRQMKGCRVMSDEVAGRPEWSAAILQFVVDADNSLRAMIRALAEEALIHSKAADLAPLVGVSASTLSRWAHAAPAGLAALAGDSGVALDDVEPPF